MRRVAFNCAITYLGEVTISTVLLLKATNKVPTCLPCALKRGNGTCCNRQLVVCLGFPFGRLKSSGKEDLQLA